ncbi:MAG: PAC2 family protein [Actinobacteria bacterium]|nr:PAC2 family protein [Actinomycetota bacterium]
MPEPAAKALRWDHRPELSEPVMITAFEGWADAGDAASDAVSWLAGAWAAEPFAAIDPEEFYNFTDTRPRVSIDAVGIRKLEWPANVFSAAKVPGTDRDVVFLQGIEPNLKWRTFASIVEEVVNETGVRQLVSAGSLLTDVPHTAPVPVTGTSTNPDLIERHNLVPSRYQGPTGILSVLAERLSESDIPWMSLWATVPHYVGQTASPKATLALVERVAQVLDATVDTTQLGKAAEEYVRQISEVVESDEDVSAYVRRLEEAHAIDRMTETPPDGDALAAEIQQFLRNRRSS